MPSVGQATTRYGPLPIGLASNCSRVIACLASGGTSRCDAATATDRSGFGSCQRTVYLPTTSALPSAFSTTPRRPGFSGETKASKAALTCSAVSSSPFWNLTPRLTSTTNVRGSGKLHFSARTGTTPHARSPGWSSIRTSGSTTWGIR